MLVHCTYCLKEFNKLPSQISRSTNHFCSRSCSTSFTNKATPRRKQQPRECIKCHKRFEHHGKRNTLCPECQAPSFSAKESTIAEYTNLPALRNRHPSWRFAYIRNLNRTWNKNLLNQSCQKCGYSNHIELAHIKPIGEFPPDTKLGEVNSPNNILTLCPNHHWEFDNGLLKLEDIPSRT